MITKSNVEICAAYQSKKYYISKFFFFENIIFVSYNKRKTVIQESLYKKLTSRFYFYFFGSTFEF